MSVDNQHSSYKEYCSIWKKSRAVVEGQEAIHKGGIEYLPKLSGQSDTEYKNYRDRALFYNATQRTVDAMSGLLFRKDAKLVIPSAMEEWLKNVDFNGNSLNTFVEKVSDDILSVGRYGILVEHPVKTEEIKTVADAERIGMRPFLTGYKAEDIVNWNTTVVNNMKTLNLVVLRESATEQGEDEFTWKSIEKYRVLDLIEGIYRQRVFRKTDSGSFTQEGEDVFPKKNGQVFNLIPFILISSKDCDFEVVKPPILDLVNVNISHYKSMADLEHGAHFTGLPTPIVTGHSISDGEEFRIGSATAWIFPDENADAKYLEFTGAGLDALEKRLASKEHQMATLGARLLADEKSMAETAEAHIIKRQGENSALSSIAQAISNGVVTALTVMAEWGNVASDKIEFEINKDFIPTHMDSQMLTALLQTWQTGGISFSEFIRNLQDGEIVDAEKTAEDIKQEIDSEGPIGLLGGSEENNA